MPIIHARGIIWTECGVVHDFTREKVTLIKTKKFEAKCELLITTEFWLGQNVSWNFNKWSFESVSINLLSGKHFDRSNF